MSFGNDNKYPTIYDEIFAGKLKYYVYIPCNPTALQLKDEFHKGFAAGYSLSSITKGTAYSYRLGDTFEQAIFKNDILYFIHFCSQKSWHDDLVNFSKDNDFRGYYQRYITLLTTFPAFIACMVRNNALAVINTSKDSFTYIGKYFDKEFLEIILNIVKCNKSIAKMIIDYS
jgi:hypothetical protein